MFPKGELSQLSTDTLIPAAVRLAVPQLQNGESPVEGLAFDNGGDLSIAVGGNLPDVVVPSPKQVLRVLNGGPI
jgi:hypothetical protein